MNPEKQNSTIKNILYILAGLGGISLIILIHETGHFIFAKLFNVPTPLFSLGFGPALWAFSIGETTFRLSLFPFGGYVEMDPEKLAQLAYIPKMLITFAGILFNLIFAYCILLYYAIYNQQLENASLLTSVCKGHEQFAATTQDMKHAFSNMITKKDDQNGIIGPIGIISIIGKSLAINPQFYWFVLAILSLNMGLFNLIPLPFFDGGKALLFTIEALTGKAIPSTLLWFISALFLALFTLFIMKITVNDIKQLIRKK